LKLRLTNNRVFFNFDQNVAAPHFGPSTGYAERL